MIEIQDTSRFVTPVPKHDNEGNMMPGSGFHALLPPPRASSYITQPDVAYILGMYFVCVGGVASSGKPLSGVRCPADAVC